MKVVRLAHLFAGPSLRRLACGRALIFMLVLVALIGHLLNNEARAGVDDDDDGYQEAFAPLKSSEPEIREDQDRSGNENESPNSDGSPDSHGDGTGRGDKSGHNGGSGNANAGSNNGGDHRASGGDALAADLQGTINAADVDPSCKGCEPYVVFTGSKLELNILSNFMNPRAAEQPFVGTPEVVRLPSSQNSVSKPATTVPAAATAKPADIPVPPGFEK